MRTLSGVLLVLLCCAVLAPYARGQTRLIRQVVGSGAAAAASSQYLMAGTVGQPIIGRATSSSHAGALGFWYTYPYAFTTSAPGWQPAVTGATASVDLAPNPASERVQISLEIPYPGHVSLTLVDAQGATRLRLIDQHVATGTMTLALSARDLPSGDYTVLLEHGPALVSARLRIVK